MRHSSCRFAEPGPRFPESRASWTPALQRTASQGYALRCVRGTLPLRHSQHQPHVLDGRARCALAEIVESRDQNGLAVLLAGEDIELELIGLVQRLRLEPPAPGRIVLDRHHRDIGAVGIT